MQDGMAKVVYDVRDLSRRLSKMSPVGRVAAWGYLGIGIFVLILSALVVAGFLGRANPVLLGAGTGFGVFLIGLSCWALNHERGGAELVSVDGEGIHLQYRRGRQVHLQWADPHLSFVLEDGSVLPTSVTKNGLLYKLKVRSGDTPLTREAFFDLLSHAQQRELVFRSGRDRVLLMPPEMWLMDYHIRGSAHRAARRRDNSGDR
jgi:hypothetical protein